MRWRLICSALFLIIGLLSTTESQAQLINGRHSLRVQADVLGLSVLPMQSLVSKKLESRYRLQGGLRYSLDNRFSFSYAISLEQSNRARVRTTMYDYRFTATTHQLNLSVNGDTGSGFRPGAGVGFVFGQKEERGTVRIGEVYFDPFVEDVQGTSNFTGFRLFMDFRQELTERLDVSLEASYVDLKFHDDDDIMVVTTLPTAGRNFLSARRDGIGIGLSLYFSYRL